MTQRRILGRIVLRLSSLAFLGTLTACVTVTNTPAPPLGEISRTSLEQSLNSGNLRQGFNDWSRANLRKSLPVDYLDTMAKRIYEIIEKPKPAEKESTKSSAEKVATVQNLFKLNSIFAQSDLSDATTKLNLEYRRHLNYLISQGFFQLSILYALDHPQIIDSELRVALQRYATEIPNPWALRELTKSSDPSGEIDPAQILKACVTVWVDRGIKIEQGVGTLDRVIGSAFFVEKSGYLLTNYHVISSEVDPTYKGFSRLYIRVDSAQSEKIPAKVIGWDPEFDLALLKVEITPPALVPLTSLAGASTGTRVLAFGSPGGLDNTVTSGIVSAQGRRFIPLGDILQIDAPVNPGNSGGPLLSARGDFLGIVFAGIQQFQGVNFSVPASWIASLLPRLFEGGKITHPWLGIQLFEYRGQVRVAWVSPGSPAYQLGITPGASVLSLQGKKIVSIKDAYKALSDLRIGQIANLEWSEGAKGLMGLAPDDGKKTAVLMLADRPEHPLEASAHAGLDLKLMVPLFGMRITDISPNSLDTEMRVDEVIPGSNADEGGFSAGDTFKILDWRYDTKNKAVILSISANRRTQAFFPQALQIANFVDGENLL